MTNITVMRLLWLSLDKLAPISHSSY